MLGSKLSWRPQIDSVKNTVNKALYGLECVKSHTTGVLRKKLVMGLVCHKD